MYLFQGDLLLLEKSTSSMSVQFSSSSLERELCTHVSIDKYICLVIAGREKSQKVIS